MQIHPTAIVSPGARLADDVAVGPYSVIGPEVTIGAGTTLGPHVVIDGKTVIGARNQIFPFACIGTPPQDVSYRNEDTGVEIGDDNIIREHVNIHRGTARGNGVTRMGNGCFIMTLVHIGHDCQIGNNVLMVSTCVLGGHVEVGDFASIGGLTAIHQFVRVGTYAFIGGHSGVRMDIPPYMLATLDPAKLYGPNLIGLRRSRFAPEAVRALKLCYRIIFRSGLNLREAIVKARGQVEQLPAVETLLSFLEFPSRRGITR